jgi:hypothetical protein
MSVFLRLVAKTCDQFLEQRIDITYCMKIEKNAKNYHGDMIPNSNDKVCNGNSQYSHDP